MGHVHRTGRLIVGVAAIVLAGGCASGTASPTATLTPAPTSPATATITITEDVTYLSATSLLKAEGLDVYAPVKAGPWPVVVIFHGDPYSNTKTTWTSFARRLADLGFVVFVPSWGHGPSGAPSGAPTYDQLQAMLSETACAVAFAATHAAEYGGDPATMTVFGHSGGASIASMVTFARPEPAATCLGGTTLGEIDALVTWDGDWMAIDPIWDDALTADPRILGVYTPGAFIAAHKDQKVSMLASEIPAPYVRDLSDPTVRASFFAVRDPSGSARKQLEASGALADGKYDLLELQRWFFSVLQAQGNPVSFELLTGATHDALGGTGADILLAAIRKAASQT
jgi:acetyl esterase/lipase